MIYDMSNLFLQKHQIPSLVNICLDYVAANLIKLPDLQYLQFLPSHRKSVLVKKILVRPKYALKVNFNDILKLLVDRNLKVINLNSCIELVNDETLKILEVCEGLGELRLQNGTNFTAQGLRDLIIKLKNLKIFIGAKCIAINDESLQSLSGCKRLEFLDIGGCDVTDEGLMFLAEFSQLKFLTISNTKITGNGITRFVNTQNFVKLEELRIDSCQEVTNEIIKNVVEKCPNITILTFNNCSSNGEILNFELRQDACKNLKQLNWTFPW